MAKKESTPSDVLGQYKTFDTSFVGSGIPLLDLILSDGKGIPLGKFIEITSPSGLGKSTMLLHISNYVVNKLNRRVLYLDFEEGVTEDIMSKMNLMEAYEADKFILRNPVTYEATESIFDATLQVEDIDLIMVDSITSMLPSKLQESSVEDSTIGVSARLQSSLLQKYKALFKMAHKTIIWVTQRRTAINIRRPNLTTEKSAAGKAFEFFMDARIEFRSKGKITQKVLTMDGVSELEIGNNAAVSAFKNRCGGATGVEVIIPIIYGKGVSNVMAMGNILTGAGLVAQSGAYFIVNFGEWQGEKFQGYKNYNAFLKKNYDKIFEYVTKEGLLFLYKEV